MALLCLDIFGFRRLYTMPALGGEAMGSFLTDFVFALHGDSASPQIKQFF